MKLRALVYALLLSCMRLSEASAQELRLFELPSGDGAAGDAPAATGEDCSEEIVRSVRARTLKGHTFLLPARIDSALLVSHFTFRQGFAYTRMPDVPRFASRELGFARSQGAPIPGADTVDVELAGVSESLAMAIAPLRWLELFLSVDGQASTGIGASSALIHGANAEAGGEAGIGLRIWRSEKTGTQVTLRLRMRHRQGRDVLPGQFVAALQPEPGEDGVSAPTRGDLAVMIGRERTSSAGWTVSIAQALHRHLGLQASAESRLGIGYYRQTLDDESVDLRSRRSVLGVGAALTASAEPYAPVAALLEYRLRGITEVPNNPDRSAGQLDAVGHHLAFGVHYLGGHSFVLGMMFSMRHRILRTERVENYFGELVMQHFF